MDAKNLSLCLPRPSSGLKADQPKLVHSTLPENLPPNHILIKVDRFGFSANNVTYQALGESPHFRYFEFHSPPEVGDVSPKTHGLVPVWGFATVVAASHPKVKKGERVYGYFAPARFLLVPVSPTDVNAHTFYVPRPHLPADRRPYNQIIRCSADPQYDPSPSAEDRTMLYRPLFWTAYWCEDWLNEMKYRGATRILISSASSKTAFCLAYCIKKRNLPGVRVVGLTSKNNVSFTKGLKLYDAVEDYDSLTGINHEKKKWIYVDVAGNDKLNKRVLDHLSATSSLVGSISLGMTTLPPDGTGSSALTESSGNPLLTDQTPSSPLTFEPFFMPEWLNIRKNAFALGQIFKMQNSAWKDLMRDSVDWVKIERVYGGNGVKAAYEGMMKGGLGPDRGYIWSLWDEDEQGSQMAAKL